VDGRSTRSPPAARAGSLPAQVWDADPPEYYDPPGGLMSFRMDYGGLVNGSAPLRPDMQLPSFAGHFELVNHQLVQARPARNLHTASAGAAKP